MNSLRPCPFCGSNKVIGGMISYNEWPNFYAIHCNTCHAVMTFDTDEDETVQDVIDRYNRRVKE